MCYPGGDTVIMCWSKFVESNLITFLSQHNSNSEMYFQPILKSMTQEEILKQIELHFLRHFQISKRKRFDKWICYPESKTKMIYHKLRLILSWLNGVRVNDKRMEDRHVLAYTMTLMKKYRPSSYSMILH